MFGIYLHIPFCRRRCPYCDFAFVVRKTPPFARFADALRREIAMAAPAAADSLYLGGGTPSLLPGPQLRQILARIPLAENAVRTIEANPEDIARFDELAELGFDRISLGTQSLHDRHLKALGRMHTRAEALRAVERAAALFPSVNADLIFGVPGMTVDELLADAHDLLQAGARHISAYGLTVHEGTLLARDMKRGSFRPSSDDAERAQFLALHDFLGERGLEHYEISNYALPGHRSAHNEIYWTGGAYRGFGPSAHSYDPLGFRRYWNVRSLDKWMSAVEAGHLPLEEEEVLDESSRQTERLYLGLRRCEGVAFESFPGGATETARTLLAGLEKNGLLRVEGARLTLTPEGMAVADAVVERLLPALVPDNEVVDVSQRG